MMINNEQDSLEWSVTYRPIRTWCVIGVLYSLLNPQMSLDLINEIDEIEKSLQREYAAIKSMKA